MMNLVREPWLPHRRARFVKMVAGWEEFSRSPAPNEQKRQDVQEGVVLLRRLIAEEDLRKARGLIS